MGETHKHPYAWPWMAGSGPDMVYEGEGQVAFGPIVSVAKCKLTGVLPQSLGHVGRMTTDCSGPREGTRGLLEMRYGELVDEQKSPGYAAHALAARWPSSEKPGRGP